MIFMVLLLCIDDCDDFGNLVVVVVMTAAAAAAAAGRQTGRTNARSVDFIVSNRQPLSEASTSRSPDGRPLD